jgi:hypothetical protein
MTCVDDLFIVMPNTDNRRSERWPNQIGSRKADFNGA